MTLQGILPFAYILYLLSFVNSDRLHYISYTVYAIFFSIVSGGMQGYISVHACVTMWQIWNILILKQDKRQHRLRRPSVIRTVPWDSRFCLMEF